MEAYELDDDMKDAWASVCDVTSVFLFGGYVPALASVGRMGLLLSGPKEEPIDSRQVFAGIPSILI